MWHKFYLIKDIKTTELEIPKCIYVLQSTTLMMMVVIAKVMGNGHVSIYKFDRCLF